MSHPHFALSPLKPTASYPVNLALARFTGSITRSVHLFMPHWQMLLAFFEQTGWRINESRRAFPRLWIEQAHAEAVLKKKLAADPSLAIVHYEFGLSPDGERDDWVLLSSGLCARISDAIGNGVMEAAAPELHNYLGSTSIEWRECGGMHGLFVNC
jgi:hypothetical protein